MLRNYYTKIIKKIAIYLTDHSDLMEKGKEETAWHSPQKVIFTSSISFDNFLAY